MPDKSNGTINFIPPAALEKENDTIWLGGRGPRLTPAQKRRIREYCLNRDGSKCMICTRDAERQTLEIDHIDGNASNHWSWNLRLVHHSCNSKDWNRRHAKQTMSSVQGERERAAGSIPSIEISLNKHYEPSFRRYCFARALESKANGTAISKNDLRIMAREFVGCSGATAYSYMERLFAPNGPLMEKLDAYDDTPYVRFRDPTDFNLTVQQLESKYPKEGRISRLPLDEAGSFSGSKPSQPISLPDKRADEV